MDEGRIFREVNCFVLAVQPVSCIRGVESKAYGLKGLGFHLFLDIHIRVHPSRGFSLRSA